ncbi:hypothetical protein ElyMa_001359000 [Elysia marginata]|uniref:Sushi domain-containing protein n=1 Tax=Elysia marginata TaxID=1093978 RepID=A0AAV4IQ29_9GAST|nr:hypothetical protein ElyMa_001359000 [Elysia marginata]
MGQVKIQTTPGNSCPDLRDRISIDISITTSTTSDSGNNNNNNNNSAKDLANLDSTKRRSDVDPMMDTPRSMASRGSHHMASKSSRHGVILSTAEHRVGTVVQVTCATDHHSVVLECSPGGFWNTTIPTCPGGLDTSPYRLYLAVAGSAAGLVLLVLFFLYCHLLRSRRRGGKQGVQSNSSLHSRDTDRNLYVDPYHVGERLYGSPNSPHFSRSDITYAKPIVYSTYLNPAFYEDAYERWRRQEQMVSERLYDSPWLKPRGLQKQMDTPGFKWSQTSLRTIGDSGFKKLPRAHITMDQSANNMSRDSLQSRDQLNSQSPSGMLRLYPSMAAHDPRAHHMTSHDDVLTEDNESLSCAEQRSTDDGRTNF